MSTQGTVWIPHGSEVKLKAVGILPSLFQEEGSMGTDIKWFHGGTSRALPGNGFMLM